MPKIYSSADQLIGKTPILELVNIQKKYALGARIFAKLEYLNPTGSVKDRAAKAMLDDAENNDLLKKGATVIEPTSGNTGIGIASCAAARGYKAVIVMPETMSVERRKLMAAYGARVVLSSGEKGMSGAIEKAAQLQKEIPDSIVAGQFVNPANVEAHRCGTGPEIYDDMDGKVDLFVAGVGSGGTVTGVGEFLKERSAAIKVVAVEPASSAVLSGGAAGPHKIQGIGAGFVPKILNLDVVDEVIAVGDGDALSFGREIGKTEGIMVGVSSGAALAAAVQLAKREENRGKNIVTIFPDSGDRYLSGPMFEE